MIRRLLLLYHGISEDEARWIASKEWLDTPEWRRCRYDALEKNDGRCELCGRSKHELPPGVWLNVDHIKPRKTHPWLALKVSNLQVLDGECNHGKGNRSKRDWRKKGHPHLSCLILRPD